MVVGLSKKIRMSWEGRLVNPRKKIHISLVEKWSFATMSNVIENSIYWFNAIGNAIELF